MTWPTEIDEMKTNEPAKETGPAAGEEAVPAAKAPKPVSARTPVVTKSHMCCILWFRSILLTFGPSLFLT